MPDGARSFPQPYVSIVVTSRNDNHGGTLTRRMQTFVNALIAQCRRHQVPAELVIVEWNPPVDRPKLIDALVWPRDLGPCSVRIIEVPPEVHARYKYAASLPLYQFIAKNVGLRRARGEFILATNIDILLNDELMTFIAQRRLEKGRMYRIDRHDVETFVPVDAPVEEMLEYCSTHLLRVNARGQTYPVSPDGRRRPEAADILGPDESLSLGAGWFEVGRMSSETDEVFRLMGDSVEILVEPAALREGRRQLTLDMKSGPGLGYRPFTVSFSANGTVLATRWVVARQRVSVSLPSDLPPMNAPLRIRLTLEGRREEIPMDPRPLLAFGLGIELTEAPPPADPDRDVFPTSRGIGAGGGWYHEEKLPSGYVRWLNNEGEIWYPSASDPSAEGLRYLVLDVEAGPSAGDNSFPLWVTDEGGREVFRTNMSGVQCLSIPLPATKGAMGRLVLHVDTPCLPGPDRVRTLNLLLRRSELRDHPEMLFPPPAHHDIRPAGIQVGERWYALENTPEGPVRWMRSNATIYIDASCIPEGARSLGLDMTLGPSAGPGPRWVSFLDRSGATIFRTQLQGRQVVVCPLPKKDGALLLLGIHVDSVSLPYNNDPRMLDVLVRKIEFRTEPPPFFMPIPPISDKPILLNEHAAPPTVQLKTDARPPEEMPPATNAHIVNPVFLHNNACGDFTLMHRDHWFNVRGHAEWDAFSLHLDSLLCFCAQHSGAVETMLEEPMRIYHIEHSVGSGWTPEGMNSLLCRIRQLGIPDVDWREVAHIGVILRRWNSLAAFSPGDWGLEKEVLKETVMTGAR